MREFSTPLSISIPTTGNLTDDVVSNAREAADTAVFSRRTDDGWVDVTAGEFHDEVRAVAKGLVAAGVEPGDRVALLSNERSRAVKFQIDKGKVEIASSSPEFGEAKEVIIVEYDATPVTICFNAQYVLDFLNVADTDSVGLEFKDEMSQAVMKPVGADNYEYTYVIMPMRV